MSTERAFVMVWDGLRPSMVSPDDTPTLWQLAEAGVWFERSHAVYPTLTRANSPAIATGSRPGRSGVPGNTFLLRSTDGTYTSHSTGDVTSLQRLAENDGRRVILVDTLADRVHRAGKSTVVVGSGSPGSAWLQHPRAIEAGDPVIADGVPMMRNFFRAVQTRFGPLPTRHAVPASRWTAYFTRIVTEFVLPELRPDLLVYWHTDPDHTLHALGYSAPQTRQSLRDADTNLAAILRCYETLRLRSSTAVVVTSDHGGSSVTQRARPARDLASVLSDGAAAENGGSVFVYTSDSRAVEAIRQFDYVGPIFTRHGDYQTFPLSLVGLDGPRAPDLVYSMQWSADEFNGVPGVVVGPESKLAMDHGSISPFDVHNTLVVNGPDFRAGWRSPVPVGNIDISPTLVHLLGLDTGSEMEGRVVHEALTGGTDLDWETREEVREFTARGREWRQRVWFDGMYLAGGTVEPR